MTDVEASTPGKRKSLSNKQGRKGSPKKSAPDTKTPQKVNTLNKGATPKKQNNSNVSNATPKKQNNFPNKQNSAPNKQNSAQKSNKKSKQNSESDSPKKLKENNESGSPKKLKAFAGTSEIQTPNAKGKRKGQFHELTIKVKSGEKEIVKTIENKINAIQTRDELTKTAKRKLKLLLRLKNIAEGKPPGQSQQVKSSDGKSASTKRHDRKKKAILTVKKITEIAPQKPVAKPGKDKTNGKAVQKGKPGSKQVPKKAKLELEDNSDDESEEDDDTDEVQEESGEEDEESGAENAEEESDEEVEGEDSDEGEDLEGSEEEDEAESEEETPPQEEETEDEAPRKKLKRENVSKNERPVNLDELKKSNLLGKNQKRFVLFVGNIPYDTNKVDLIDHFKKCGEIKHIRIPTEKKSSRPRGFAYVEVENEETYQKCLSMHHSFLKGRRVNVLYTQGGKKKGEEKKKEIKAKNFKLHAMRKQGQLAGSQKETQKRSFRRAKQRTIKGEQESQD